MLRKLLILPTALVFIFAVSACSSSSIEESGGAPNKTCQAASEEDFKNINDADSYFALLALSFLIISGQFLLIYLIVFDLKHFLKFLPLIIFSTIMLLLWVLNVIAYLKRR